MPAIVSGPTPCFGFTAAVLAEPGGTWPRTSGSITSVMAKFMIRRCSSTM